MRGAPPSHSVVMQADDTLTGKLEALLQMGVEEGAFTQAAAWIAHQGRARAEAFTTQVNPSSLWDVASLTKPMAVVTEAMRGVAQGWLSLDDRVRWPLGIDASLRDLLAHRAGLPAWDDLWALAEGLGPGWQPGSSAVKDAVAQRIGALAGTQQGTRYSDLGFITLGWHLERTRGRSLDAIVSDWRWSSSALDLGRVVPTGHCPRRQRQAHGEVDDLNAWVLGSVAGHAGLFATLDEVGCWALGLASQSIYNI